MLFDSIQFMIFFPIVFIIYFAIPKKIRYIWLLISSYYFYLCWNPQYSIILLATTLITYIGALQMRKNHKKVWFVGCLVSCIAILAFFKYWLFALENINHILSLFKVATLSTSYDFILPVGISFFTFQSLGYLIDVYKGKAEPEKNFAKYALFVSFFPTIISGPIERSGNLLRQICVGTDFSYENAQKGLMYMALGYFEKLLIANRIGAMVDTAFNNYTEQTGATLLFAIFLYAIQIYADFAGYSYLAIGMSKVLGFELIENFKRPYFSLSIKEFWKRWHISLSQWLRDYVYISLGGNRKGKVRTYVNLLITFLVSGLWHGANWQFVVWGGLHGVYQICGTLTMKLRNGIKEKLRIKTDCFSYRLFQAGVTFVLVDFAWLFFRAPSLTDAFAILERIATELHPLSTLVNYDYYLGLKQERFTLLIIEVLIMIVIDALHEKQISIIAWLNKQNVIFRWIVYIFVSIAIITGMLYNYGAESSTFIYAQF